MLSGSLQLLMVSKCVLVFFNAKTCISFHFVVLQERFLEKAKLSPDYFIADCEDMLVNFSNTFFFIESNFLQGTLYKIKMRSIGRNTLNAI